MYFLGGSGPSEADFHSGPCSGFALQRHLGMVDLRRVLDDGQAQASAARLPGIEGMPERVSAVMRTNLTSLLPRLAYSVSQMAEPTPSGTHTSRDSTVISSVLMMVGSMDTLVELYF